MTFVDASELDRTIKRVALWVTTFLAVATALAMLNKFFIADPIINAVAAERIARVAADEELAGKLSEIAERQAMFTAAATSQPGSIERRLAETYLRDNALRVRIR